ncbi:MAG: transcription antitermination factor NusB, partial [Candidatus Omnitrophica bacterium]|nr:transcription antitermination factor NusB [Candidatus Omnitrophota bacterium]
MRKRTRARELALQILYQVDVRKDSAEELLENLWEHQDTSDEILDDSIKEFTTKLANGTMENLERIDSIISTYAENWQLDRMAIIDRNVMRMAAYELLYMDDIPLKVSINEAVELAKKYG